MSPDWQGSEPTNWELMRTLERFMRETGKRFDELDKRYIDHKNWQRTIFLGLVVALIGAFGSVLGMLLH